jgi:hypothetical protein
MHLHCYVWTGMGEDLRDEADRRVPPPPGDPASFISSPLPPMRTCDWLLKPARRIDATHTTVDGALAWLAERYEAARPSFLHPDAEAAIGLGLRLDLAREALEGGVDVQWGFWLTGGRFTTCGVVCCSPNRHARHRCPAA